MNDPSRGDPTTPTAPAGEPSRSPIHEERQWALRIALCALLAGSLPVFAAWLISLINGTFFVGNLYLPDDVHVYLAWMRQARDGRLLFENRFTTDAQSGALFNFVFLVLGNLARIPGLSLLVVYHAARVLFGFAFLLQSHGLLTRLLVRENHRKAAYLLLCFSAGFGWLFPREFLHSPTDLWQVETNTFLSLSMNTLFAVALWLMVIIFDRLLAFQREGGWVNGLTAGMAALLLANSHSYDILIVGAVWIAYLAASGAISRRFTRADVLSLLILIVAPAPAIWQQWRYFQTDPVFHARVLTETVSPNIGWYLLGLGLLVPFGIHGAVRLWTNREGSNRVGVLFLAAWALAGLALPYVPVSFQRKLAMGIHIPWAILGGVGVAELAASSRRITEAGRRLALLLLTLASSLTLFRWFVVGTVNIETNWCEADARIFLTKEETEAIGWLSRNGDGASVLAMPLQWGGIAGYLPGLAGVTTYAGHWGETPDFSRRLRQTLRFYSSKATDEERRGFLRDAGIRYVYWSRVEREAVSARNIAMEDGSTAIDLGRMTTLRPVFRTGTAENAVTIFQVN